MFALISAGKSADGKRFTREEGEGDERRQGKGRKFL